MWALSNLLQTCMVGLVRGTKFMSLGPYGAQCLGDLLRRRQPAKHVCDQGPQRPIGINLSLSGHLLRRVAAPSSQGDASRTQSPKPHRPHRFLACICWNLLVTLTPYRVARCCTSDWRPLFHIEPNPVSCKMKRVRALGKLCTNESGPWLGVLT